MPATKAACYGKLHGHAIVGALCVNCGMSRQAINALLAAPVVIKKAAPRKRRPDSQTMHSEAHVLARDVSEYCREPKAFALFLGRIVTVGLPISYKAFSELKDRMRQKKIKLAGRWWVWKTKQLTLK